MTPQGSPHPHPLPTRGRGAASLPPVVGEGRGGEAARPDRVPAMTTKVTGPASYFPSIEKTYGQPMQHWFDLIAGMLVQPHMQIVAFLKDTHAMGHGHANAIVAHQLAAKKGK